MDKQKKSAERIGQLRHRAKLMKPTFTRDAFGGTNASYTEYAEIWCDFEFRELRSDERDDVNRVASKVYARVRARYNSVVNALWRVIYEGIEYDVLTVMPTDPLRQYMMLECERDDQTRTE